MSIKHYDVVIVGASFGGVAAALAAAHERKVSVALLEPSSWVGGQATAQGVTRWDEAGLDLIETTGSTASYRYLRHLIREHYKDPANATLSGSGLALEHFNPGFCEQSYPFSVDPSVTHAVLKNLLQGFAGTLDLYLTTRVVTVAVSGSTVESVTTQLGDVYTGTVFLDATDLGDLLPLANIPWTIGAEAKSDTGEPDAPELAHPEWVQAITVPIALELRPDGERHVLPEPANYAAIARAQQFEVDNGDIDAVISPKPGGAESVFGYRRYIDPRNFDDARFACGRTTLNVGSNDLMTGTLPTGDVLRDRQTYEDARQASIAFAYWLQTQVERDDGNGLGYPNLMVRTDAFGTDDGCAPAAYIRESRRIHGMERVVQQDIAADGFPQGAVRARNFPTSCGIGWYGIDIHACDATGTPWLAFDTLRFQIPLGTLLPKQLDNFIASCKNIGATHLTSGAYRVHPVEWAIGEAAGVLAALSVTQQVSPKTFYLADDRRTTYQYRLLARGIPIFWWADVAFESDARVYAAAHLCGVKGIFSGSSSDLDFKPDDAADGVVRSAIDAKLGLTLPWPATAMTRAQAAVFVCEQNGWPIG